MGQSSFSSKIDRGGLSIDYRMIPFLKTDILPFMDS